MKNQDTQLGKRSHKVAFSNEANGNEENKESALFSNKRLNSGNEENSVKVEKLYRAAIDGDFSRIYDLMKKGIDLNIKDVNDNTVVHIAAFNGHIKAITTLIKLEAKLDIQNKDGNIPLYLASSKGSVEAVNALRKNLNLQNKYDLYIKKPKSYIINKNYYSKANTSLRMC